MQREIKFQFWIESEKRMIDAIGFCFESETQIRIWYVRKGENQEDDDVIVNESFACHNVSSREYSGIKDGNGKPIYEGDIIRVEDKVMEVIFDNGCFYTPHTASGSRYRLGGWVSDRIVVFGNMYEKANF